MQYPKFDNAALVKLGYPAQLTVGDLIDRLSQFPADAPVWASGCCMDGRVDDVDLEDYGISISSFIVQDEDLDILNPVI